MHDPDQGPSRLIDWQVSKQCGIREVESGEDMAVAIERIREISKVANQFLCDHIGDAVEIIQQHNPTVVGIFELCGWLEKKGAKQISPMNKGGTQEVGDVRVTMVHADHSCGILDDGKIIYGGEAVGYVIEFSGGFKIYHAGDTNLFGDMKLIGELYRPDLAMLPIGGYDPYIHAHANPEQAWAMRREMNATYILPMHHSTFRLSREPVKEPIKRLLAAAGRERWRVALTEPGQTWTL